MTKVSRYVLSAEGLGDEAKNLSVFAKQHDQE